MAVVRVSWTIDEAVAHEVGVRATAESRSVSQMASLLLREALGEEDLGVEPSSAVPPPGLGSSSPSVEVLGEGDPSDGSHPEGDVSAVADPGVSSRAVAGSSPSPSTSFVAGLLDRDVKPGECERVLSHRKGEFCKACGKVI